MMTTFNRLDIIHKHPYVALNEHHRKLFSKAAESNPDKAISNSCNAGWLIHDDSDSTECDAIFIAHSTTSALQLLREILPQSTLSDTSWEALSRAASLLDQEPQNPQIPQGPQGGHSIRASTMELEELFDESDLSLDSPLNKVRDVNILIEIFFFFF